MEILKFLEQNQFVKNFNIIDFKNFGKGYFFKIKVFFSDESELIIHEYVDVAERIYSYHWQDKYTELIKRWDNSTCYKNLETFPHHIHLQNVIIKNFAITFADIFKEISDEFIKNKN